MEAKLELPGKPKGVVMRFAPNPNGPATLGSARGIIVNSYLVKKYSGKFILRFDDTDPKLKKPLEEAYRWYLEDMEFLGAKPDQIVIASERIPTYYEAAEKLIELGKAYVCLCEREKFKELKDRGEACPHRETGVEENLILWQDMLSNKFNEGEAVLRIKTDLKSPDPALRDWVAFRVLRAEHPRVGKKFVVWPMLDFESAIEDHLLGVTHIIRGKDLMDSEKRQKFIYEYLRWEYPETLHWGRLRLEDYGKLSTTDIGKGIAEGKYTGWDDLRLPTIRALKRRGITSEAIKNSMLDLGLSESDIAISMENIYAENRKIVDSKANRYFFVENPVELIVDCPVQKTVRMPLHPSFRERGVKEYTMTCENKKTKVFISDSDAKDLNKEEKVKLIGLPFVEITKVGDTIKAKLTKKDKKAKKIHWVQDHLKADVLTHEGTVSGYCEMACSDLDVNEIIQFERFGFCRVDSKKPLVFCFGHA